MIASRKFSFLYQTLRNNGELGCWITALAFLFFLPEGMGQSLCLFKAAGFTACPGCGIGHSMHDALRLRFSASIDHHPLGIIAIIIIFNRITLLIKAIKKQYETKSDKPHSFSGRRRTGILAAPDQ